MLLKVWTRMQATASYDPHIVKWFLDHSQFIFNYEFDVFFGSGFV